jgi:hypothetical protein
MTLSIFWKTLFILTIGCFVVLASCNIASQSESNNNPVNNQSTLRLTEESEANATLSSSTTTAIFAGTPTVQSASTQTVVEEPLAQSNPTLTPYIPTPSATVTKTPAATQIPIPSPTTAVIKCDDVDISSLPGKAFPTEIDVGHSHIVFDGSLMYLALDQYIGVFDMSEPAYPQFWGFWEPLDLTEISGLEVYGGVAYVTDGNTLHILNLSSECRFASIATIDLPLHIFHLEIENSRLYVGGVSENQEQDQVVILSITIPDKPEPVGVVNLSQEPTAWSVSEEKIYSLGSEWTITDVSNMDTINAYPMNVQMDWKEEIHIISDTIYLFSWGDGVSIISNLEEFSPTIKHNPTTFIMLNFYGVQGDYILIGDTGGCDGVGCDNGSFLVILSADTGEELSTFMFDPHTSILRYVVQGNFLYAFSEKWMYVVDISNIHNPEIISRVLLIT